jgi:hypothetical protein
MSDKVILVTPPDDILVDGLRILLVELSTEQTQLISDTLTKLKSIPTIVTYIWNSNDMDWLLDKKLKSDLIIFNADSEKDVIIGYMAAQSRSYYFGTLKDLSFVNNSAIYTADDLLTLMEKTIEQYGRKTR